MRVLNSLAEINISRILRLIWLEKKISRVDIASRLGMDKSTVTKIASELSSQGIIREAEAGESGPQGGRKPVFLELNSDLAFVGGIEINPQKFFCSILNLNGETVFEYAQNIDCDEYKELGLLGFFEKAFNIIKKQATATKGVLLGIGVGLPALIDVSQGMIIQSIPMMIYEPVDFIKKAQAITGLPVFFDNDARCCCYTEKMIWRNSSSEKNMMYVLVQHRPQQPVKDSPENISVGFGFVLNGKIYHGANSTAGEFRSMLWKPSSQSQFATDIQNISKLSDKAVTGIFKELAQNVAFLVNTLNLDVVYVGGIDKVHADELVKYVREDIEYLWPYEWNKTSDKVSNKASMVTSAMISDRVVSVGAGILVLDNLFGVPELGDGNTVSTQFYDNMSSYQWLLSKTEH